MGNSLNNKKIGFLIIMLLFVLIIVILIWQYLKREDKKQYIPEANGENFIEYYSTTRDAYFDVNSCMRIYLNSISTKNNVLYSEDKEEFNKRIYDLLSRNYIEKNNITLKNLYNYVENIDYQVVFVPLEIKTIQNGTIKSFVVHGLVENIFDLSVVEEIFAIVNIDIEKKAFTVEPIYGDYNNISEIRISNLEKTIYQNTYNKFSRNQTTYEDAAEDYLNLYKRIAIGAPEKMYELLDEQYKIAKFENEENFKKYIEDNKKTIIGIRLEKYNATEEGDYTKYICIDQYGNYYIFKENDILDYSVLLDTYTVDLPEFINNYYGIEPTNKIALNIQKIFDALNDKDYRYVYNKLADSFKSNYFSTLNDFEKYAKNNFFDENKVEYLYYKKESEEYYSYTIKVINEDNTKEYKVFKIIMSLQETTNFMFSFNID